MKPSAQPAFAPVRDYTFDKNISNGMLVGGLPMTQ
jgi:hypothetical protein